MNTRGSLISEIAADVLAGGRATAPEGDLPLVWSTLVELGWPGIAVDEHLGGAGGSLVDLATALSVTAARGVSVPLLEASIGCWALAGSEAQPEESLTVCATTDQLTRVPWARHASRLVVLPDLGEAYLVDLHGAGVAVEHGSNLAGEPRDTVHLTGASDSTPLPNAPTGAEVTTRAALLNAAALTGAARGAVDRTREHVTTREQFGRPLIALKAVAQGLATMRTELSAAESALDRALDSAVDRGNAETATTATAKVIAARAATGIARTAHQLHGAVGVTREHPLHHVTRKLWAWRDECGSQRSWAIALGKEALSDGEAAVWDRLTSPS
ncbi:acyl-CoA dehydrogenase family protein [Parasphingorhabdus pacifica]